MRRGGRGVGGRLLRRAARTGRPDHAARTSIPLDSRATQLACGGGSVWASSPSSGTVTQIDAATGDRVAPILTGAGASGLAFGDGALWVANTQAGTVSRIDPRSGAPTALVRVGADDGPASIAVDAHGVWVSNELAGTVARIDPARNAVVKRLSLGNLRPQGLALVNGALWVGLRASGARHRGGTLRVLGIKGFPWPQSVAELNPATSYNAWILPLTSDGLVAFQRDGGQTDTQLVADLAVSLPVPTDQGRTYVFRLRPGVRYSTGQPVRASDIRRELQRVLRPRGVGTSFYMGIRGASACVRTPPRCDLSRGVVVDDTAGTITFHLDAADPDFLYKLAQPFANAVPPGRPATTISQLAATGPYIVAALDHTQIRLRRNPRFRQWSATARPDGYPDTIDIRLGVRQAAAVRAVEHGTADYALGSLTFAPAAQVDDVFTRYAAQAHSNPVPSTVYMALNIRTAPFDNVDARQALNYAVDRRAVAAFEGGPHAAQPTCQILPPSFPGYRPYCPYTDHPNTGGTWTAPDLDRARRLVARSHTHGMRVTLLEPGDPMTRYVGRVLRRLGYQVRLRTPPRHADPFAYFLDPRHRAQIVRVGWYVDYPAAADFLQPLFSCAAFHKAGSNFCDAGAEQLMAHAQALQAERRPSEAAWARADRRLVDVAAAVPLINTKQADLVSRRVGNFQFSAYWSVRLDQLWVR